MKRLYLVLLLIVAALVTVVGQPQQAPPDGTIPANHYCKAKGVPIGPREKNAHPCDCRMTCQFDEYGRQIGEGHTSDCLSGCERDGRKCTCHTESPCPGSLHARQGWTDMHGHVVAVTRKGEQ